MLKKANINVKSQNVTKKEKFQVCPATDTLSAILHEDIVSEDQ